MHPTIKLITLNVNGIAEHSKRQKIYNYLKTLDADIVCLQETHSATDADSRTWTEEWGGEAIWNHGSNRSRGTAVLFNPKHKVDIPEVNKDNEGRVIALTTHIKNTELNIVNVYAPTVPTQRKVFFANLWQYLTGMNNVLLAGDFNCIPDLALDKQGGNPDTGTTGNKELMTLTNTIKVVDIWRTKNPAQRTYTWHNRDFSMRSRLDRWYVDKIVAEREQAHIRACPFSDHSAVEIQIDTNNTRHNGPGVWKMNTSLLKESKYTHEIKAFLIYWQTERATYPNLMDWWDEGKRKIKNITIKHSVKRARNAKKQEKDLLHKLTTATNQPQPDQSKIEDIQEQLNQLADTKQQGVQIRSRASWIEHGEKSTGFFLGLEKKKQPKHTISELETPMGPIKDDKEIIAEAQTYYQQLYTNEDTDIKDQDWLLEQLDNTLTEPSKISCEGPLTLKECTAAVKAIPRNKAPGTDGLPIEFYQHFWDVLKTDLVKILNTNYEQGQMTTTQQEALLRLLYKKHNKKLLKNWRPISLLNVDYKIASKALATRLRQALPDVINYDQTCGIPDRTIFENLFRLRDITQLAKQNNTDAILINIDQEKAFDRVNHQFLQRTLAQMNFGPSFRRWIEVLYARANCRIINNGWISDPVNLHRGVRQGCPLSPLLYVIVAETLSNAIRKDPNIHGIALPGTQSQSKITQYADDSTLTLKDDPSIQRSFEVIARFEGASGSKLNLEKTEGIYVGKQAGRPQGPAPIKWRTNHIEVLGTNIGNSNAQNWENKTEKAETALTKWANRDLTITGRTLLIRTYAIASIVYLATVFTLPNTIVKRLNSAIFKFLWKGRNELLKRDTMHLPRDQGGLAIPDLKNLGKTLKSKGIQQITDPKYDRPWVHTARYWIGTALSTIRPDWAHLRTSLKPHADPSTIPAYYQHIKSLAQEHRTTLKTWPAATITAKNLALLTTRNNPRPRAATTWQRLLPTAELTPTTWRDIWSSLSTNKEKETIWKLTHRILTTKAYLAKWGMQIDTSCPFCGQTEDTYHALISCARAIQLWTQITALLRQINNTDLHINFPVLVFSKDLPTDKYKRTLTRYLLNTGIALLWNTRNKEVYKRSRKNRNLCQKYKNIIRNRIRSDFINNKLSRLALVWTINGTLCTYNGTILEIKI